MISKGGKKNEWFINQARNKELSTTDIINHFISFAVHFLKSIFKYREILSLWQG